ncbi:hypothetical protein [Streptomyces sp. DSM 40750]|nr:hypothetical protein [Streptomyces sp. DSM 40750]UUU23037.1 hypothetical protein JIX55_23615 [Streptomyces sp. DSM 40750]
MGTAYEADGSTRGDGVPAAACFAPHGRAVMYVVSAVFVFSCLVAALVPT